MIEDKKREIIAEEFGVMFAKIKFKEMLIVENQPEKFSWDNFPEIFQLIVKVELLKFSNFNYVNLNFYEEIAIMAYIDEGYKLKENFNQQLPKK